MGGEPFVGEGLDRRGYRPILKTLSRRERVRTSARFWRAGWFGVGRAVENKGWHRGDKAFWPRFLRVIYS